MMRNKTIYILVLLLVLSVNIVVFAINSNDVGNKLNYESDVIYQILTDRFFDGDSSNNNPYNLVNSYDPYKTDVNKYFGGDWQGIINKIQYLANMGVSAIWISPPYDNMDEPYLYDGEYYNAYHGYWAKDYFLPDEHWGSMQKFNELINIAHSYGIKVIIDFAPNHTSHRDGAIDGALYRDGNLMGTQNNDYQGLFHHNGNREDWETTRFDFQYKDLANLSDLSQENSIIISYLNDAIKYWLNTGIDGIRNDAILHQNDAFLKSWANEINAYKPVFHFGEFFISKPSSLYNDYSTFQDRTGISFLDFEYAHTVRNVFGHFSENMYDLESMLTYTGNDYTYENDAVTFIDNHDMVRFYEIQPNNDIFHTAIAFHLTSRGTPVIYYGTEQYINGYDCDDGRQMMPSFNSTTAYQLINKLASLRKDNPAIQYGSTWVRWINSNVIIYERQFYDDIVLVAVNRSGYNYNISGLISNLPAGTYNDHLNGLLNGNSITVNSNGSVNEFNLGPTEVGVWEYRQITSHTPQIGAVGPTMGRSGNIVAIDGEGFGFSEGIVKFDNLQAAINSWSNTHIEAIVPNITPGLRTIRVTVTGLTSNAFNYEVLTDDQVQVIFHVEAITNMGEKIYIVGNVEEIGNWDPSKVYMPFHNPNYPEWFLPVSVPVNKRIEFKFIKKDENNNVVWESGSNRVITTPSSGSIDTVLYYWRN